MAQSVIRRIGDAETTNIWQHNWIPRDSFKRPITALVPNPPKRVVQLIDVTPASWNEDLVLIVFTHIDAKAILRIPLCKRRVEDFCAWHVEFREKFGTRLAYRMILRTKHSSEAWLHEEDGTSYEHNGTSKWSMIWHMEVPFKLKMFV